MVTSSKQVLDGQRKSNEGSICINTTGSASHVLPHAPQNNTCHICLGTDKQKLLSVKNVDDSQEHLLSKGYVLKDM